MKQSLNRAGQPRRTMLQVAGFNFYDVFVYAFCIIFALICVYPMWYVLICSITPYEEYIKGGLMLWPTGGVDLQYYRRLPRCSRCWSRRRWRMRAARRMCAA